MEFSDVSGYWVFNPRCRCYYLYYLPSNVMDFTSWIILFYSTTVLPLYLLQVFYFLFGLQMDMVYDVLNGRPAFLLSISLLICFMVKYNNSMIFERKNQPSLIISHHRKHFTPICYLNFCPF